MLRRFSVNFALFSMALDGALIALTLYTAAYWRNRSTSADEIKSAGSKTAP
jgi:hypothetical protein